MEKYREIEKSIIKKFRKEIWSRFTKAVRDYKLIQENDKVMVCISGGKDSFLLAKCIQELERHSKISFQAFYVIMNPGYSKKHLKLIMDNAKLLNVPVQVFETDIFEIVNSCKEGSPCYLCARMRRGHLYNKAKELGCNKIALGHHFNDVIETTLLSMIYGSEIKTMLPKVKSTNYKGLELIRPLYLVKESSINAWKKSNGLEFINCACKFTENAALNITASKRKEIKELIASLNNNYSEADNNIFKSLDNINLNCVLGYKKDDKYTSFLDIYED